MSILLIFKYFKLCRLIKPIELNAKCKSCNQYAKEWAGKLYHSIFPKTKKKGKSGKKFGLPKCHKNFLVLLA